MRKRARRGLAALAATLCVSPLFAQNEGVRVDFDPQQWRAPSEPIGVQVSPLPDPARGRVAFFIGRQDVTALFRATAPGRYVYAAERWPLPSGEHELAVYLVTPAGEWQELQRYPLKVLTATGFERAEVSPRLEVTEKSQFDEGHSEAVPAPERPTYNDMGLQGGFTTAHRRDGLEIVSSWNFVGSSVREEALRFGTEQRDAPKVDLSDYRLEVRNGNGALAVGHVSYGEHPLLLSGLANRGFVYRHRVGDRADVSVTAQSGSSIVGYDRLLGLTDSDHYISAIGAGYDLLPEAGRLRLEATYVNAEVRSALDFNVGEVPDAERSEGVGLRLLGQSESGRLRGSLALARSRYTNPADPLLAQGEQLVPVRTTTSNARSGEISYELVQNAPLTGQTRASLTITARHDRADPLYSAVGAALTPDQATNALALSGQIGSVALQLRHAESEDNLDDIPTVLKTKTRSSDFNLAVPLQSLLGETPSPWWPVSLSYSAQRVHQFGANLPPSFDPATHIPDQLNLMHNVSLNWSLGAWSVGYVWSRSNQDNRQPGRALADFDTVTHTLNVGGPITERLNVNVGLSRVNAEDVEQQLTRYNTNGEIALAWRFGASWSLSASYGRALADDSADTSESTGDSSQLQLAREVKLPWIGGRRLPGQFFLRYARQVNTSKSALFGLDSTTDVWTWNGGFSLSFF